MPRASLLIIVAALILPAAAAGGQPGTLELRFHGPAQAGDRVTAVDATWLLVVFGDEGSGDFSLRLQGPVDEHNLTAVNSGSTGWDALPAGPPRSMPGMDTEIRFPDGLASLYLEGARLRVDGDGVRADLQAATPCLGTLVPPADQARGEARYTELCPRGPGAAVVLRPLGATLPVRIVAEGLRVVEYHHAELACRDGPSCPGGGMRWEQELGPTGIHRVHSFERLTAADGELSGTGRVHGVLAGSESLDLAVAGWARLPLAMAAPGCAGCMEPDGRTLRAAGDLRLDQLRVAGDGVLAARLGGAVQAVRLDEGSADPGLLGLGTAAAAAATVALAAWAAAGFFSRIPAERSLDHPRRGLAFQVIRENPGIHLRALSRLADMRPTLAQHHVDVLLRAGHVVARRRGRLVCLFENHGRYGDEWRALAALREPPLARLHCLLEGSPGMSRLAAVEATAEWGWSRRTAYHRLRRLEAVRLVQASGDALWPLRAGAG